MDLLPLLMIPDYDLSFFSLTGEKTIENIQQHVDANKEEQLLECIGSSHGWLAFSHRHVATPFLCSPFSGTRIHLPSKHTLPRARINHHLSKIEKLVICGDDPSDDEECTVIIAMHTTRYRTTKIAFCRPGDEEWADLGSELVTCYDVVCCDATRTAYVLGPGPTVEAWDMKGPVPKKKMVIDTKNDVSCPAKLGGEHEGFPCGLYRAQWYLALSNGQLFLAVRYIRCSDEASHYKHEVFFASKPLPRCPYKTKGFYVFKYDAGGKEWVEVKGLGDEWAMFVGGNQMMILKTDKRVKGNAIYFTDDNWDGMNESKRYGGHDMGVFNMGDWSIHPVLGCHEQRIVPPPFWFSPQL